ncbi:hypothetical protein CPC08DRAFT_745598 [Agrocybe pediades]|nr:hypothetical protein CPC08DRAFT_745598 [Agrocybe pediades]
MSEIDDIFASKAKGKKPDLPPADPLPSSSSSSSKKKKKKKTQDAPPPPSADVAPSSKKRPAPETVVDTSDLLIASSKRQKTNDDEKKSKATKADRKKPDVDPSFTDSRGTGDRRKTEEGWSVYKEDELGINDEGGGKLLYVPALLPVLLLPTRHTVMSIRLRLLLLITYCNPYCPKHV